MSYITEIIELVMEWLKAIGIPPTQRLAIATIALLILVILYFWPFRRRGPQTDGDENGTEALKLKFSMLILALACGIGLIVYWWSPTAATSQTNENFKETQKISSTPHVTSVSMMLPSPSPLDNTCSGTKMTMQHFGVIKYGGDELRLTRLLSPKWRSFWARVGFKKQELDAQKPMSDTSSDKENKLEDIIGDWMAGKFYDKGHKATYEVLVELLNDINLEQDASDFLKVVKDKAQTGEIKITDKVNYQHLYSIEHNEKEVRLFEVLKDHWMDFGRAVGYPVVIDNELISSFTYFCDRWLKQSLDKKDRDRFPATFEGFKRILLANKMDAYAEDFTTAVEQAGICQFEQ